MVMVPAANFSGVAGWRWPSFHVAQSARSVSQADP
jgi:hypothetical protein